MSGPPVTGTFALGVNNEHPPKPTSKKIKPGKEKILFFIPFFF
jgi:hypothetical protein